jgi:thiol-disulfide isomerase/thioredoxin
MTLSHTSSASRRSRRLWLKAALLVAAPFSVGAAAVLGAAPFSPAQAAPLRALSTSPDWLNTPPLRAKDLRGKVVVVNFWTYSCINSLRALPYLRAWSAKYKDQGLVVIGVHTPEFAFEKDLANVRQAVRTLGVGFPVTLDSDGRVWRAFGNNAWPAFYVIDADGRVRHQAIGEGNYDQSERVIQKLLSERDKSGVPTDIAAVIGVGPEVPADLNDLGSGETYVGYAQANNFASPGGLKPDRRQVYLPPRGLALNTWSLTGDWTVGSEFATAGTASGRITYRFHARDLHMVLGPTADGRPVRFQIRIDGAPPGADHGVDTDNQGMGAVQAPRMYQLVRQAGPVADRVFEIEFLDPGVRAYVFTFG